MILNKTLRKFMSTNILKITDVTVRDGLQSYNKLLSVKDRADIVKKISSLNINELEVGSIVSPKIIPQMRHSLEVFQNCKINDPKNNYHMLVSNEKGMDELLNYDVKNICFFTSPSDTFNRKNINCTVDESFKKIKNMKCKINKIDVYTKGYLSCITDCPYEGKLDDKKIVDAINRLYDLGMNDICLSDTLGTLKAKNFNNILSKLDDNILKIISVHLHQELGSDEWKDVIRLCISKNIYSFDTSLLNLGGCPAAFSKEKKSGNLDLFDLISFLEEEGIKHNIKKNKIKEVELDISKILNKN